MSVIIALTDIVPGDGATVLVPGSHKSMIKHPVQQQMQTEGGLVEGAEEMHLRAGDAIVFNDRLCHGSAARVNEGDRRILCFRYLPKQTSSNRCAEAVAESVGRQGRAARDVRPYPCPPPRQVGLPPFSGAARPAHAAAARGADRARLHALRELARCVPCP
jgi:hypothetical protein